jgi:hypothetical protein
VRLVTPPLGTIASTPSASAVVVLAHDATAAPLTETEQACVNAMNDAGLAVARTQAALTDACLDPAAPGASADVPACVANDGDADLVGATKATFDAAVAACAELPAFGVAPTVDQGVNDEHPDRHVTTGLDGHFVFDGLEEGSEATVVLSHPDYHAIQTGTIKLGSRGIDRVTFQAVIFDIYDILAALLGVVPDDANLCQMVTTVTRVGKSIYDPGAHGEDGVTVTLDPPLAADHGPIYFNSSVLPDRALTQTSDDGGVLSQVPPGEYTWTAHKAGAVFSRIKMKCRVGYLVNASPPKGLQRH